VGDDVVLEEGAVERVERLEGLAVVVGCDGVDVWAVSSLDLCQVVDGFYSVADTADGC